MMMVIMMGCVQMGHGSSFYYTGGKREVRVGEVGVWVDKDFGEEDRLELQDAIDQWNYALNGREEIVVKSWEFGMGVEEIKKIKREGGWIFLKIDSENGMVKGKDPIGGMVLAFVNRVDGTGDEIFFVRDRMGRGWMRGLALHEMGHLLGAQHKADGLMDAYYDKDKYICVDKDTAGQVEDRLRDARGWAVGWMKYCVRN